MILKKRGWMRIKEGTLSAWFPQEGTLLFSVFTTNSRTYIVYSKKILFFYFQGLFQVTLHDKMAESDSQFYDLDIDVMVSTKYHIFWAFLRFFGA